MSTHLQLQPMHQLRPSLLSLRLDHVVLELTPVAKRPTIVGVEEIGAVELADDVSVVVVDKSDQSQSLIKRS
jgi:hypothetical protein